MVKLKPIRHSTFRSYSEIFAARFRDEAIDWARDNILLGAVMLVVPPAVVYARHPDAKLDWETIKVALTLYAVLLALYLVAHILRTMWILDDEKVAMIQAGARTQEQYRKKLEEIDTARPRIKLKQPGGVYTEPVNHNFSDKDNNLIFSCTVPFLKVRFVNDPVGPYPSAKANDVRATVNFYRIKDGQHILAMDGRWADSSQPPALHPLASKTHLLATSFGIGEAHSLDIAYRDGATGKYYAWNNDNYSVPDFRLPQHLLEGDLFRVDVRLQGDWIDNTFSFTFKTIAAGFDIG